MSGLREGSCRGVRSKRFLETGEVQALGLKLVINAGTMFRVRV